MCILFVYIYCTLFKVVRNYDLNVLSLSVYKRFGYCELYPVLVWIFFNFAKPLIMNSFPGLSLQQRSRCHRHQQASAVCECTHGEILLLRPAENSAGGNNRLPSDLVFLPSPSFPSFF